MEVDKYLDREKLTAVGPARPFVPISEAKKLMFANALLDFMAPIFNESKKAEVEKLQLQVAELMLTVSGLMGQVAEIDDDVEQKITRAIEREVVNEIDRKTSEFITEDDLKDSVQNILNDVTVDFTV